MKLPTKPGRAPSPRACALMPVPAPRPPVLRSTRLMVRSTWEGWRARELRGWHGQSWIAHCGSMGCSGPANAARPTSSGHTHTRVRERAHARARVHTHTHTHTHTRFRGRPHGAHASAPVHTCPHLGVLLRAVLGLLRQNVDVLVQPRAVDGVDVRLGLRGGVGQASRQMKAEPPATKLRPTKEQVLTPIAPALPGRSANGQNQ